MGFITNWYFSLCLIVVLLLNDTKCINANTNVNENSNWMADSQTMLDMNSAISRQHVKLMRGDDRLVFEHSEKFVTKLTTKIPPILNVTEQRFVNSNRGEYEYSIKLSDGTRRGERGDFEYRNGIPIFIIRGFFSRKNGADKRDKITTYIFDHTGYHEIPWFDPYGSNFRPDYGGCSEILEMGDYCIDSKLLKLLVG